MESEAAATVSSHAHAAGKVKAERIDSRELLTCASDPALITAAESITQSFLTAEPEAKPPVKRPRTNKQRCGCALSGTCHVCSKCLEKHCTCGERKRHRSLCLESRACNCLLIDPTDRCALCHGCRREQEHSHCRCEQHEQQRLRRARGAAKSEAAERKEKANEGAQCKCFALSTDVIPPTGKGVVSERSMRIRRLRRTMGIPSVANLYQRKIGGSLTDDEDALNEEGEGGASVSSEGVNSVVHEPLARSMLPRKLYTPPYQSLHLGDGTTLLESIEPKEGTRDTRVLVGANSLVDYLVHASSVKVGGVGELVGAFDDSAALAAAIVVEEYMKQIVGDLLTENRSVCSLSKASVQTFASHMLKGFNWAFFFSPQQRGNAGNATSWAALVSSIYDEFAAVEKLDEATISAVKRVEMLDWIREMVVLHYNILQPDTKRVPAAEESSETSDVTPDVKALEPLLPKEFVDVPTPHVRVGVHRGDVLGNPSYNFTLKSKLAGDHYVRVSVDNIESEQKALSKIEKVKKALAVQHKRIWRDVLPTIPIVLQKQRAAALEFETKRRIMKLPKKVKRYFDMKDEKKRDEHEKRKKRWNQIYAEMIAAKGTPAYKRHMERLQRRKDERAANKARRKAARAVEQARRKEEQARRRVERQRLKEELFNKQQEERAPQWTKIVEKARKFEDDPAANELLQQLRQQVREAVGSPSSRPPPGPRRPYELDRRLRKGRQSKKAKESLEASEKTTRLSRLVLPEMHSFHPETPPSMDTGVESNEPQPPPAADPPQRRRRGRPRKVVPSE